jgi:hypothetical protein
MQTQPQQEHQWLQKLVGEWTYEHEAPADPDQPAATLTGTETVRSIGDVWVSGEAHGEMACAGPTTTVMTLGYDPQKGRFVGTFFGSMMTYLWVYEGSLDSTGNCLVLDTEGPDFTTPGKMARYRDTVEFKNDDHRVLRSEVQGEDGEWTQIMCVEYHRKRA